FPDTFAPERVMRRRGHSFSELPARALERSGQQVVHEGATQAVSVLIERDDLHERHPDTIGEPSVDLPFDDHWVDARATVVDGDETPDLDLTRPGVDVDYTDVGA